MPKITIIGLHYKPEKSGNAPYTSSLAAGLMNAGHEVRVITGFPHYPEWRKHDGYNGWYRREDIDGVPVMRLRHHVPRKPSALHRLHMELSFGIRSIFANWRNPDVVLLVSPALFATAVAVVRARFSPRKPSVVIWVQDLYSRGIAETSGTVGLSSKLAARLEGKILGSAHGVVVIHERFRQYIIGSLGVESKAVTVIRNWTHLPVAPSEGQGAFRQMMGWGEADFVVLHAGNMGKKQGLENVVDAARESQRRNSNVKFVLMGDGNQKSRLEALAVGASHLTFVDSLPDSDFQLALTSANALLVNELPGVKDMSVPSKLTSYFNAGVPVIAATDAESVTAFEMAASEGGVRVDAADPVALVDAAEVLCMNTGQADEYGQGGLRYRHETLSESTAIGHYDEFITSLATSRGR